MLYKLVVAFLHGNSLNIDNSNAHDLAVVAQELGIPLIENYAKRLLKSSRIKS